MDLKREAFGGRVCGGFFNNHARDLEEYFEYIVHENTTYYYNLQSTIYNARDGLMGSLCEYWTPCFRALG